jgi:hypothetical protein
VFAELMKTVRGCSLGQITKALFEVGGEYRVVCNPRLHNLGEAENEVVRPGNNSAAHISGIAG